MLHGKPGTRGPDGFDSPLDRERERAVQKHPRPATEPVLDLRLVLAEPPDALHQVRVVDHRVKDAGTNQDRRARHLARAAEVLLVPDEVVVEEERPGKVLHEPRVGVEKQLPVAVEVPLAAHALGDPVSVRTALGKLK